MSWKKMRSFMMVWWWLVVVLMVVVGGESNLRRSLKLFFKILQICMACKLCYEVLSSVWLLWVTTSEVRLRIGQ